MSALKIQDLGVLKAVARHMDLIRTGALDPAEVESLVRTGQCGPPQATMLKSWGSGCPLGFCPPDNLPEALGRYFAGDRAGCRELPFGIVFSAPLAGEVTTPDGATAPVTMCPTRLIAISTGGAWQINVIQFGIRNQLVQGPAPAIAFAPNAWQLIPMVPDCLRSGQPYTITVERTDAGMDGEELNLIFIGPAVG
jgi:hypothetical protein